MRHLCSFHFNPLDTCVAAMFTLADFQSPTEGMGWCVGGNNSVMEHLSGFGLDVHLVGTQGMRHLCSFHFNPLDTRVAAMFTLADFHSPTVSLCSRHV